MQQLQTDICVIGAGSGGLSVAAVASQMGAKVVLIEKHKMGGDCLNYGCVPSKSLLAAAKRADAICHADLFGVKASGPNVDFKGVHDHVHGVVAQIAPHDSVERFVGLGVKVIQHAAKFTDEHTVVADDYQIKAKKIVIATGSRAKMPTVDGIGSVNFLTNETIFDLQERPEKLLVMGGGPIGCELAQAYRLLSVPVTLISSRNILPKDDPELADVVRQQFIKEGIDLHEMTKVIRVVQDGHKIKLIIEKNGQENEINGSHLLVATGRKPSVDGLNLEAAGIEFSSKGIVVDQRLRTNKKHIYAIGDAAGSYQFTHAASYHAGIVIRNMLFHLPAKVNYAAMPWVTYTHPELAHVGLNEAQVLEKNIKHRVLKFHYNEIDRAQAERETVGMIKVITSTKGVILGASIVGHSAGELILPWVLAITNKLKISAMAGIIVPYPTLGDLTKRVAGEFYTPTLYSDKIKKIVRFLLKF